MDVVQVALMGVVSSAVAAMDAHRGVAAVAEAGLDFLHGLSASDANRVCARSFSSVDSGQGGRSVCVCVRGDGAAKTGCVWHGWRAARVT